MQQGVGRLFLCKCPQAHSTESVGLTLGVLCTRPRGLDLFPLPTWAALLTYFSCCV